MRCSPPSAATQPRCPAASAASAVVRAGSGLSVDGREYAERGGWDPYEDWNGAAG